MVSGAQTFPRKDDLDEPVDVALVTSDPAGDNPPARPEVTSAIRYLLYRHELTTGLAHLPQRIAVVSATSGEGVTTVSRSLAEVLATEKSSSVCWIDFGGALRNSGVASLPRPDRAELPGIPGVLSDVNSVTAAERGLAPVRRLSANTPHDLEAHALAGRPELDSLMDGLAREYRYIVFDTPPLLSRADSIGFLRHADAYILVTRQGSTTINQVRRISDELRNMSSLGAILNDFRTRTPRSIRRLFAE